MIPPLHSHYSLHNAEWASWKPAPENFKNNNNEIFIYISRTWKSAWLIDYCLNCLGQFKFKPGHPAYEARVISTGNRKWPRTIMINLCSMYRRIRGLGCDWSLILIYFCKVVSKCWPIKFTEYTLYVCVIGLPEYSSFCLDVSGQYTMISILSDSSFSTSFLIRRNMNGFRIMWSLDRCPGGVRGK